MELIIKTIAEIAVDAMYNTMSVDKWKYCKELILDYDSSLDDKNIRVALLVAYGIIERDALPRENNEIAITVSEEILGLIAKFDNEKIESWFNQYLSEEISKR